MATEADFLAALRDDPNDEVTRLVFADWLAERDDPRETWMRDADLASWSLPDFVNPIARLAESVRWPEGDAFFLLRGQGRAVVTPVLEILGNIDPETTEGRERRSVLLPLIAGIVAEDPVLASLSVRLTNPDDAMVLAALQEVSSLGAEAGALVCLMSELYTLDQSKAVRDAILRALGDLGSLAPSALRYVWRDAIFEGGGFPAPLLEAIAVRCPHPACVSVMYHTCRGYWVDLPDSSRELLRSLLRSHLGVLLGVANANPPERAEFLSFVLDEFGEVGTIAVLTDLGCPDEENDRLEAALRSEMHAEGASAGDCFLVLRRLGFPNSEADIPSLIRFAISSEFHLDDPARDSLVELGAAAVAPLLARLPKCEEWQRNRIRDILRRIGPAASQPKPAADDE